MGFNEMEVNRAELIRVMREIKARQPHLGCMVLSPEIKCPTDILEFLTFAHPELIIMDSFMGCITVRGLSPEGETFIAEEA